MPELKHCEKPCTENWSSDVDGEHRFTTLSVDTGREHCDYCTDSNCPGREYHNPLLAGSDWTDPKG
jgi:hypothetical protein